jgi:hypothetical protein
MYSRIAALFVSKAWRKASQALIPLQLTHRIQMDLIGEGAVNSYIARRGEFPIHVVLSVAVDKLGWCKLAKIENERILEAMNQFNAKRQSETRKMTLKAALSRAGLEYRVDSQLCHQFIYNKRGTLTSVVKEMCHMRWLFEYTDYRRKMQIVMQNLIDRERQCIGYNLNDSAGDERVRERIRIEASRSLKSRPEYSFPQQLPWVPVNVLSSNFVESVCRSTTASD